MAMTKPKGFIKAYLTDRLFKDILTGIDKEAVLKSWSPLNVTRGAGYITDIVGNKDDGQERMVGLYPYELEYTLPNLERVFKIKIMFKSKCTGNETVDALGKLIPDSEEELAKLYQQSSRKLEIHNLEYVELECIRCKDETLKSIMPKIYWHKMDPDQDIFIFAMEFLDPEAVSHFNSVDNVKLWQEDDIVAVLDGLALFHARFYEGIDDLPGGLRKYTDYTYKSTAVTLYSFLEKCAERSVKLGIWNFEHQALGKRLLGHLPEICDTLDKAPRTLIHNDVNLINICLRKETKPGEPKLCMYDWEFSKIAAPQLDVALFFITLFPEDTELSKWHYYVEKYYSLLVKYLTKLNMQKNSKERTVSVPGFDDFKKVFDMAVCERYIYRYNWPAAIVLPAVSADFFPRFLNNATRYAAYVAEKYNFV